MKLIDRYIIRQYCINFAILLVILLLLFVLVDLIFNLDEFLEAGQVRADQWGGVVLGTAYSILDYYYPLTVLMYVFFSGMIAVAAMGFTFASLQRNRELTALLASGVSLYRVAMPVIVVGIAFNALALPAREFVLPHVAPKVMRSVKNVKHDTMESFRVWFAPAGDGNLLSAQQFDVASSVLKEPVLIKRDAEGLTRRRITAQRATWQADRGGWRLEEATVWRWDPTGQRRGRVGDRRDRPALFYASDLSPEVLISRQASKYARFMSVEKLQSLKGSAALQPGLRRQIVQAIWSRFSLLVLNVLVLVMGLPFFLRAMRGNMLHQAILASTVVFTVWGGGLVMLQMSPPGIGPVVAAWLPVVICLPLSAVLLQFVRT